MGNSDPRSILPGAVAEPTTRATLQALCGVCNLAKGAAR
jgi:hypothetical protein